MSYDLTPERLEEIERNLDDRLRSEAKLTGHEPISTMATRDLRNIVRMARRALEIEAKLAAVTALGDWLRYDEPERSIWIRKEADGLVRLELQHKDRRPGGQVALQSHRAPTLLMAIEAAETRGG